MVLALPRSAPDSPLLPPEVLVARWRALHEAAAVVAGLAGVAPPVCDADPDSPVAVLGRAGGWRAALAGQAMADLAAILEGGLKALLAVHAGGADPRPAAQALWEEFVAARAALAGLAPPGGALQSS